MSPTTRLAAVTTFGVTGVRIRTRESATEIRRPKRREVTVGVLREGPEQVGFGLLDGLRVLKVVPGRCRGDDAVGGAREEAGDTAPWRSSEDVEQRAGLRIIEGDRPPAPDPGRRPRTLACRLDEAPEGVRLRHALRSEREGRGIPVETGGQGPCGRRDQTERQRPELTMPHLRERADRVADQDDTLGAVVDEGVGQAEEGGNAGDERQPGNDG